jgi:hypothetical protein
MLHSQNSTEGQEIAPDFIQGSYPVSARFPHNHNNSSPVYELPIGVSITPSIFIHYKNLRKPSLDSDNANTMTPDNKVNISGFSNEPYEVLEAIPVIFRTGELKEIVATFEDANISFVGESRLEALNGLKAEILDTLEDYEKHESQLGPGPRRQIGVLRKHIRHIR